MSSVQIEGGIPADVLSRARALSAPSRSGKYISLMNAMTVKLACTDNLPLPEAFAAYAELMGLDDSICIRTIPIRGLCDVLESDGEVLALLEAGGRHFECRTPRIVGPGSSPILRGRLRRVVAGRISNAVVHGRTGAFLRNNELVMDVQRDELDAVPNELAFDPVIFHREKGNATYLEDSHPGRIRHLHKAWSLLGKSSHAFGHWTVEQLIPFIAGKDLAEFQGLPLLVDEDIPPQHFQSLEIIGEGRFEIIKVARGERVSIDELYVITNFPFAPHLLKMDQHIDASYLVYAADAVAGVFTNAAAVFDTTQNTSASLPDKLFWARPLDRYRKISNHEAIEDFIAGLGCKKFYPEQLGFGEQIRLIRAAKRIVVQNGSASHGLFFARPGTEVVMLSHPALPFMALYAEMLAQLGIDFKVVTGPFTRKGETYLDQSDYEIPLQRLAQVIGRWSE